MKDVVLVSKVTRGFKSKVIGACKRKATTPSYVIRKLLKMWLDGEIVIKEEI